jgi:hypothetical protein
MDDGCERNAVVRSSLLLPISKRFQNCKGLFHKQQTQAQIVVGSRPMSFAAEFQPATFSFPIVLQLQAKSLVQIALQAAARPYLAVSQGHGFDRGPRAKSCFVEGLSLAAYIHARDARGWLDTLEETSTLSIGTKDCRLIA